MSIYPHPFDKRCLLAGPLGGDFGSHLWPGWQGGETQSRGGGQGKTGLLRCETRGHQQQRQLPVRPSSDHFHKRFVG